MVGNRKHGFASPRFSPCQAQTFKGLGRRHLMDQVAVDIDEAGSILIVANDMGIPQFVIQIFCHD